MALSCSDSFLMFSLTLYAFLTRIACTQEQVVMLRFLADCDELKDWMKEKMLTAKDATYDNARNLHSKWQKHKVNGHNVVYTTRVWLFWRAVGVLIIYTRFNQIFNIEKYMF